MIIKWWVEMRFKMLLWAKFKNGECADVVVEEFDKTVLGFDTHVLGIGFENNGISYKLQHRVVDFLGGIISYTIFVKPPECDTLVVKCSSRYFKKFYNITPEGHAERVAREAAINAVAREKLAKAKAKAEEKSAEVEEKSLTAIRIKENTRNISKIL